MVQDPSAYKLMSLIFCTDPVTSVALTEDSQTMLVTCLNSRIHLIDRSDGSSLQTYSGHAHSSYRIHSSFGLGEASVMSGDEEGKLWKWDLSDGKNVLLTEKVAEKAVLWTEQSPSKDTDQFVTSASDGSVKVWKMS